MKEEIFKFLSQYMTLTEEEKAIVAGNASFKHYPAGHVLLREGQTAQNCFFVLKGLVRSYYLQGGQEKITEFFSEFDSINSVSYVTGKPSTYYLACVEDTVVTISDKDRSDDFFAKIPRAKDIGLQFMHQMNARQQLVYDDFKNLTPEKRYEKLLASRPDLINRVPQYMIASYLGIQPASLSRIRKRWRDQKS